MPAGSSNRNWAETILRCIWLALALALVICASQAEAATSLAATLRVTVAGVTKAGGMLRVGLYDEATFPSIADFPLFKREIPRVAGDVAVVFENLPPGTYALRALQDVNNDGKVEAGEPVAISNDAKPGDFDAA